MERNARWGCCPGGQNRPARGGGGVECSVRGGLPWVLVRISARARPARCAGRVSGRDHTHERELHRGCRYRDSSIG